MNGVHEGKMKIEGLVVINNCDLYLVEYFKKVSGIEKNFYAAGCNDQ